MKLKLAGLANSFRYAFHGLWHCIVHERNFRIHMTAAAYVVTLAFLLDVDGVRFAVLFITISNVLIMEMLNTAVETLVDLASPERHPLAKIAKDVAAGAVLVCAVVSIAVGFSVLWQPDRLLALANWIFSSPPVIIALAVSLAVAATFIFVPETKR